MAKVLLIDRDSVFCALLEDRLHIAGHRVVLPPEPGQALEEVNAVGVDVVLVGEDRSPLPAAESVRRFRAKAGDRGTALLVIAPENQSEERVEILKAGADDYLAKPFDLEELVLRVERLAGARPGSSAILEGELENHPLWEVLQYVETSRKSGRLTIRSPRSRGSLVLRDGAALEAEIGSLRGREALIALLELEEGRFRLGATGEDETSSGGSPDAPAAPWRLNQVMMEAAWLSDELNKRREHLPPTGAPLQVVEGPKPTPPEGVPVLPMDEMLAALGTNRPTRLYDLMQSMPHAPQRVRLTAAVLNEIGRIRLAGEALISPPTTREIDQSLLIDGAVSSLITAAGRRGFNTQAVPFLVLVGKGGLAELKLLLASAPQGHEGDPIARLLDQLEKAGRGSVTFRIGEESLSLNVFGFENSERMIDTVVPVCAGVMLWLDDDPDEALLRQIVSKVETARLPAWGVVLAADAQARPAAAGITQSSARWLATLQAPRSLLGLLRLFLPAQAS